MYSFFFESTMQFRIILVQILVIFSSPKFIPKVFCKWKKKYYISNIGIISIPSFSQCKFYKKKFPTARSRQDNWNQWRRWATRRNPHFRLRRKGRIYRVLCSKFQALFFCPCARGFRTWQLWRFSWSIRSPNYGARCKRSQIQGFNKGLSISWNM